MENKYENVVCKMLAICSGFYAISKKKNPKRWHPFCFLTSIHVIWLNRIWTTLQSSGKTCKKKILKKTSVQLQYKDLLFRHRYTYYKDKMVIRLSYLYNGNFYTRVRPVQQPPLTIPGSILWSIPITINDFKITAEQVPSNL